MNHDTTKKWLHYQTNIIVMGADWSFGKVGNYIF